MAYISILNPTFTDTNCDGSGTMPYTICHWTGGTNGAWQPSGTGNGILGFYSVPPTADNDIYQDGVFTDYTTNPTHRVKVDVSLCQGCQIGVYFGTGLTTTITTSGITYITSIPAGSTRFRMTLAAGLAVIDEVSIGDIITTTEPQRVMPVYNPIYFDVNSINKTFTNFKYVFDLYTGTTAIGTYQSRIKLLPRPIDGNALYNPSRVLESRLSYDKPIQNITASTASVNHLRTYNVRIGEEWGNAITGNTIYPNIIRFSGYTFNGVQQYTQFPTWDFHDYFATVGLTAPYNFLTYQPRSGVKVKLASDRGTATLHSPTNSGSLHLTVYHLSGGSSMHTSIVRQIGIIHVPSAPWNLNQWFGSTLINTDCTSPSGTEYYTIELRTQNYPDTEVLRYDIDCRSTCKYGAVRLQFLNRLGGFDYMNFDLVSRKTVNIEKKTYKKTLPYNYVVGDREKTVLDIDGSYSTKVTSNWCNDDEAEWMEDLLASPEVYIIQDDGVALPVLISEKSIEIQKEVNKKLFNYTFNLETSYGISGQRA